MASRTVCVDFDGVLNLYAGWRGPQDWPAERPGAREFLEALADAGFTVVVFSTRESGEIWDWLQSNDLHQHVGDVTSTKEPAICYIDDRAVLFEGSFDGLLERVQSFKPHWQKGAPAS